MTAGARRVVVLGGTGFVGRRFVPRLRQDGWQVTVLSRGGRRAHDFPATDGVDVRTLDVHDVRQLADAFGGADAVVNLVGILNERGFDGSGFRRAHVELTASVIEACGNAGVTRLLQMSALRAGEGESHYLRTRGEAEGRVKASPLRWSIVRPSVIFGPGDGLFCRFASLLKFAPVLPIARAHARFAPVYVGDVAEAMTRILARDDAVARTFELSGPEVMTLAQIVEYTARHMGKRRAVIGLPDALGRLQARVGDFIPGKPISSDNFRSLALDSVGTVDGLAALGIEPTRVDAVVPAMLRALSTGHSNATQDNG